MPEFIKALLTASWRLALALLLASFAAASWAGDHIVARAYLEDPGGTLTLAQVQARPNWLPFDRG